eukprot:gene17425-17616_t
MRWREMANADEGKDPCETEGQEGPRQLIEAELHDQLVWMNGAGTANSGALSNVWWIVSKNFAIKVDAMCDQHAGRQIEYDPEGVGSAAHLTSGFAFRDPVTTLPTTLLEIGARTLAATRKRHGNLAAMAARTGDDVCRFHSCELYDFVEFSANNPGILTHTEHCRSSSKRRSVAEICIIEIVIGALARLVVYALPSMPVAFRNGRPRSAAVTSMGIIEDGEDAGPDQHNFKDSTKSGRKPLLRARALKRRADDSMDSKFLELTAEIASSFVTNNKVAQNELPALIASIHQALSTLGANRAEAAQPEVVVKRTPAQIRKSITPDALISFIDGKPYKTLKRHLTTHGETIASYKEKYGLTADYPSTAPNYSAARSAMAKSLGLGNFGRSSKAEAPVAAAKMGRPKKAKV